MRCDFSDLRLTLECQSCWEFRKCLILSDVTNAEQLALNSLRIFGTISVKLLRRTTIHVKRPFPHFEKRAWSGSISNFHWSSTKLAIPRSTLNWVVKDLILLSRWSQGRKGHRCEIVYVKEWVMGRLLVWMHDRVWIVLVLLNLYDARHGHDSTGLIG